MNSMADIATLVVFAIVVIFVLLLVTGLLDGIIEWLEDRPHDW